MTTTTTTSRTDDDPFAVACRTADETQLDENRHYLAGCDELPPAAQLVAPIVAAFNPLFDLRERSEVLEWLAEHAEFAEITSAEVAEAHTMLRLHRDVAELLGVALSQWVATGRVAVVAQARSVMNLLMGTDSLAIACRAGDVEALSAS